MDNHLVHLLSPNIYRTASEATEAFDYIMKNGKYLTIFSCSRQTLKCFKIFASHVFLLLLFYFHSFFPSGNFSFTQRMSVKYVGATAMYFIGKKLKKKHNIKDERAELYQAANEWVNALNGRDFLGLTTNLSEIDGFNNFS